MDLGKITTGVILLVVGVVLISALVIPTITNVQKDVGEDVTLINESQYVLKEPVDGDILKNVRETSGGVTTDSWTFNGNPIVGPTGSADIWTVGILSDTVYLQINAPDNASAGSWLSMTADASNPLYNYFGNVEVTFTGNTMTIDTGSADTSGTFSYSWAYVTCNYDNGQYCAPVLGGTGYVSEAKDVLLCGAYTSGDLDTMYYYHNGTAWAQNENYTITVDVDTVLHEGTTDIYDATVSATISDGTDSETFTPYRIFVPYEVSGHEASGTAYTLFGLIPLLLIVALVLVPVGLIAMRSYFGRAD